MERDTSRNKPFTELYPRWDAPKFDPTSTHLKPKPVTETSNRSIMSRLYESVLDSFSQARIKQLENLQRLDDGP